MQLAFKQGNNLPTTILKLVTIKFFFLSTKFLPIKKTELYSPLNIYKIMVFMC